jgi:DNA-binding response OmpR family regulator
MPVDQLNILIVEDQADIADLLSLHLTDLGASVTTARDGHQGMQAIESKVFDIAILDIQIPGPCGLTLCRTLRKQQSKTWVMMLTARSTELDRVLGLEQGADDYISKPFSVMELIARVKACNRRQDLQRDVDQSSQSSQQPYDVNILAASEHINCGQLSIDLAARTVLQKGAAIELTGREFDLLVHFAKQPNRVFNRSQLLDQVWGYGHDGYEHTVNSHINRLRAKIEPDPAQPSVIVTIWGVGYKLIDIQ